MTRRRGIKADDTYKALCKLPNLTNEECIKLVISQVNQRLLLYCNLNGSQNVTKTDTKQTKLALNLYHVRAFTNLFSSVMDFKSRASFFEKIP